MSCTFVPPYLLRHLADATPDAGPRASRSTLVLDARLREQRTNPPPALRTVRSALAGAAAPQRVIHSADGTEQLPGRVARSDEDAPTGDLAVDEAHASSAVVWDLFAEVFDRSSVDGEGSTLSVTVHYGQDYDNAFWDGSQLVFGDGDGQVFERFTKPMDVMAHEFTHGVIQFSAGLTYQDQSGALNESVSDVFASLTKQRSLGQDAAAADWLIGVGLFRPGINARGLRSMLEPGTAYDDPQLGRDPQVGSMADYVETDEDNGGVHVNSGIPNRAFALAANGIGGSAWEKAGRVWYDALTGGVVGADTDFRGFAEATVSSAERLFADEPAVAEQVRGAWTEVGVLGSAAPAPLDSAPVDAAPVDAAPVDAAPADAAPADAAPVDAAPVDAAPADAAPVDAAPVDAAPGVPAEQARTVAVRRSGGFAGLVRSAELDLDGDPLGPEVRSLLLRTDLTALTGTAPAPDRFVYTVALGDWQLTVPEQDLTPELGQVVRLVLDGPDDLELG